MVRMGKNPRGNKNYEQSRAHIGLLTPNLIQSIYAPLLKDYATKQSEEFAQYLVSSKNLSETDINNTCEGGEKEECDVSGGVDAEQMPNTIYQSQKNLDELDEFLNLLSKDFSHGGEWKAKVNSAKFERRLNEKYGIFRPLLTDPRYEPYVRFIQRKYALGQFSPFRESSKRPMSLSSSMILLYMLYRNKVLVDGIVLAALFLIVGLQPWALVFLVSVATILLEKRRKSNIFSTDMGKHPVVVKPFYKSNEDAAEILHHPVGDRDETDESPKDDAQYDVIVLGSGPEVLYCAALLSRTGKSVLVLSPEEDASGCCTLKDYTVASINKTNSKQWNMIPFDVADSKIGRISTQQKILAPALCTDTDAQGGVRFSKIGTAADEYAYEIINVPGMGKGPEDNYDIPFILRAGGVKSIADDACSFLGDGWMENESVSTTYLKSCMDLNADSSKFYLAKLLPSWIGPIDPKSNNTYADAACRFAGDFLKALVTQNIHVRSLLCAIGLRSENLDPSKTSMGVHISNCASVCSADGYHYTIGGPRSLCHAFLATIEANGGKVKTLSKTKTLLFESTEETNSSSFKCIGVELVNGKKVFAEQTVSGYGFLQTFLEFLPQEVRDIGGVPQGLPALTEKRPQIKFLVGINGESSELDLPSADWYRLPLAATIGKVSLDSGLKKEKSDEDDNTDNVDSDTSTARKVKFDSGESWMRISFPSAKDPSWKDRYPGVSTCVVTIEADDDFVSLLDSKPAVYVPKKADEGNITRLIARITRDLLDVYPQLQGKIACVEYRGPIDAGLVIRHSVMTGIRPETNYPGLYVCGSDLTLDGMAGSFIGSWLAANSMSGYTPVDYLLLQRNITSDLAQIIPDPLVENGEPAIILKESEPPLLAPESDDEN
eukprot:CAMPEP_0116059414 /NCGR_PEP_ID=MMETSP0322-20121206/5774_1 /TAXON_ID=163516 /ORGANISM="Leptocylindrus danicus var. apora, Strain B651" /LENGTH=888 /DNA_ID=CAMNT_0003543775 /DNA_START=224 /DNA_END=2891 /DNA_ORIENTATION=-